MVTWLEVGTAATKSPAERLAELTEGGATTEVKLPTDASKKKVNVSPGEIVSGTVLTQNTVRAVLDDWPARKALGLTLNATFDPVWARAAAENSNTITREWLIEPLSIVVRRRMASPFSKGVSLLIRLTRLLSISHGSALRYGLRQATLIVAAAICSLCEFGITNPLNALVLSLIE